MPWGILIPLAVLFGLLARRIVPIVADVLDSDPFPGVPGARLKRTATLASPLRHEMLNAVMAVQDVFSRMRLGNAVVTSGIDSEHLQNSLHYRGLALDFRTRGLSIDTSMAVAGIVRAELGRGYDVVNEGPGPLHDRHASTPHLHIEWDPRHDGTGVG